MELSDGRQATRQVRYMTWINERSFTSGFYFSDIRSNTVDLEFIVEGKEPVHIESLSIHNHPDAIIREYENGLVLANPSPRPYTFHLDEISPNSKFRRLKGTALQDPETNNGKPVGGAVELPPKDALFLVRE